MKLVFACPVFGSRRIQWGSEYRTSLVFKWSKVVRLPNGLLSECHLNTGLNLVWYSDHHFNTGHLNNEQVKVCYSDVSVIQIFVIQIPTVTLSINVRHSSRVARSYLHPCNP